MGYSRAAGVYSNISFPGISDELIARGAPVGDALADSRWFFEGACLSRCEWPLADCCSAGPFVENRTAAADGDLENIKAIERSVVEGLTTSSDSRCVTGVRLQSGEIIPADLVIDATGRGSHSPAWLESMGFPKACGRKRWKSRSPTPRVCSAAAPII